MRWRTALAAAVLVALGGAAMPAEARSHGRSAGPSLRPAGVMFRTSSHAVPFRMLGSRTGLIGALPGQQVRLVPGRMLATPFISHRGFVVGRVHDPRLALSPFFKVRPVDPFHGSVVVLRFGGSTRFVVGSAPCFNPWGFGRFGFGGMGGRWRR